MQSRYKSFRTRNKAHVTPVTKPDKWCNHRGKLWNGDEICVTLVEDSLSGICFLRDNEVVHFLSVVWSWHELCTLYCSQIFHNELKVSEVKKWQYNFKVFAVPYVMQYVVIGPWRHRPLSSRYWVQSLFFITPPPPCMEIVTLNLVKIFKFVHGIMYGSTEKWVKLLCQKKSWLRSLRVEKGWCMVLQSPELLCMHLTEQWRRIFIKGHLISS